MEYEKNKKYFTKKSYTLLIVGVVILVIGIILALILRRTMKVIAIVIAVVGVGIMIAGVTGGVKDDDVDQAVNNVVNGMEARAAEVFKFPRRYETLHKQVVLGGYDFTREEETPYKRGSDLKYRCAFYCTVLLSFTNDGLRILSRKFSILEDKMDEQNIFIPWEEVEGAKLDEVEKEFTMVDGTSAKVKSDVLSVSDKNGNTYSYCVKNTADVDETVDCIYRQTVKIKQNVLKTTVDR